MVNLSISSLSKYSVYPQIVENDHLEVDVDGQLVIDPADLSNTGRYECRATNPATGDIETAMSDVSVVGKLTMWTRDEVNLLEEPVFRFALNN